MKRREAVCHHGANCQQFQHKPTVAHPSGPHYAKVHSPFHLAKAKMPAAFHSFAIAVNKRLELLSLNFPEFYRVDCPDLFDRYLASFPQGTNPLFRERTEHDCNCCRQFVKNLGKMVTIKDGIIHTVWGDLGELPAPYEQVAAQMDTIVSSSPVCALFRTKESSFGAEKTYEGDSSSKGDFIVWHHFHGHTPVKALTDAPQDKIGKANAVRHVLKRGLDEIRLSDIADVFDMIDSNCLYRGEEHRQSLVQFRELKVAYDSCESPELFTWEKINKSSACIRNTVIGTLLVDLAEGKSLEAARASFEKKVDPQSYRRPTALVTGRMVEDAVAKLKELGLEGSVNRRFANISDISVSDIVFVDNEVVDQTKDGLTQLLMAETTYTHSNRHGAEVGIEDFLAMSKKKVELIVEPQHLPNFLSLTAPVDADSPSLFKWDNSFAWSYDGDAADSIREKVKAAGGNVDAKLRCSLAWYGHSDLDIHCIAPRGRHIYYGDKGGILDVDANFQRIVDQPVENLSWPSNKLFDGEYKIHVRNYTKRSEAFRPGFDLEVEFNGNISQFSFPRCLRQSEQINDALVLKVEGGVLTKITPNEKMIPGHTSSPDKWGLKISRPVKVNMIMLSPNHWESSNKGGNKHYFFFLDGCLNPGSARGIYNEFLKGALNGHHKVFEILGVKTKCPPCPRQLSGVGFSSTTPSRVKVIADGRPFTIKF